MSELIDILNNQYFIDFVQHVKTVTRTAHGLECKLNGGKNVSLMFFEDAAANYIAAGTIIHLEDVCDVVFSYNKYSHWASDYSHQYEIYDHVITIYACRWTAITNDDDSYYCVNKYMNVHRDCADKFDKYTITINQRSFDKIKLVVT